MERHRLVFAPQGDARSLFSRGHNQAGFQLRWHVQTGISRLEGGMLLLRFAERLVMLC